jgi:hypothetical protein
MENELWSRVSQMVQQLGNNKRPKKATYCDADIVLTYLWAKLRDEQPWHDLKIELKKQAV